MISVVCFDLDDTLCDETTSDRMARKAVFNYMASNYNEIDLLVFQTIYRKIWENINEKYVHFILQPGVGERDLRLDHANRVLQAHGLIDPVLAEKLTNIFWEERRKALQLFPDAHPVLSALQKTHPLSLLANGPSDYQRQKIDDLQIAKYFEHIIIAGEVGYAKPDTRIFDILMSHYTAPLSDPLCRK